LQDENTALHCRFDYCKATVLHFDTGLCIARWISCDLLQGWLLQGDCLTLIQFCLIHGDTHSHCNEWLLQGDWLLACNRSDYCKVTISISI
jgi:hypothetical protein